MIDYDIIVFENWPDPDFPRIAEATSGLGRGRWGHSRKGDGDEKNIFCKLLYNFDEWPEFR